MVEQSPAEAAGIKKGDVLLAMNGVDYKADNKEALKAAWSEVKPGSKAAYVVLRDGAKVKVKAKLGNVPANLMAQWVGEHMLSSHSAVKMASK